MTLYSLDPADFHAFHPPDPARFHDYTVLGKFDVTSPDAQRIVARTVENAIAHWDGRHMMCFEPRHGIRVTDGAHTYDLVICFECQYVYCFEGDRKLAVTGLTGSQRPLDELLRGAHIPLPAR